jgi:4-aminobutyrate aminotransferase-like enzyme
MVNGFDMARAGTLGTADDALLVRRQRVLGPAYRLFYEEPLHPVRGEGVFLFDASGRRYLDAYNNVPVVGHAHPRIVAAMARQAATLNTHTRYLDEAILAYAERLLATMPAPLSQLMLTCTGSEANDLAVRIAKAATGGSGFLVTANAYHGVTEAVAALSPSLGPAVAPGPHVETITPPLASPDPAEAFARSVEAALAALVARGIRPAAVIIDTILSSDGVLADPPGILAPGLEAVRRAGGLVIADEVQAGFGRTGTAFWGFARHGIVPDLVTMGKPMGNGYPVAGVAARPDCLAPFAELSRYFNTFGGSNLAIAVADAVLDVIEDEALMANAQAVGTALRGALEARRSEHPAIGAVRGSGLFIGVDVVDADGAPSAARATRIVNGLRQRGVLISASGPLGHVLKIRPPLPFSFAHADQLLDALDDVLAGGLDGNGSSNAGT